MKLFPTLAELIFPVRCLGCMALGPSICSQCRISWRPRLYRNYYGSGVDRIPVYSAIQYSPTAQRVLLASKESGLEIADRLIFESAQYALRYFLQEIGEGSLVPIPSRPAMVRKRGRSAISDLVAKLGEGGSRPHKTQIHKNFLIHTRVVRDQSLLSSSARKLNLHGALQVKVALRSKASAVIVLAILKLHLCFYKNHGRFPPPWNLCKTKWCRCHDYKQ